MNDNDSAAAFFHNDFVALKIVAEGGAVTEISRIENGMAANQPDCEILRAACQELREYFAGKRRVFDIKINPRGTVFQRKVWRALREIPFGQTTSYSKIAAKIGAPNACRAVAAACHSNPILLAIPCHRVIMANGKLGGFAAGIDIKRKLLQLEKVDAD